MTEKLRIPILVMAIGFCLFSTRFAFVQEKTDVLSEALAKIGLVKTDLGFRPKSYWLLSNPGDDFRLPYFDDLLAHPLEVPRFVRATLNSFNQVVTTEYLEKRDDALVVLIRQAGIRLGYYVYKYGFEYQHAIDGKAPMLMALREIYQNYRVPFEPNGFYPEPTDSWGDRRGKTEKDLADIPIEIQKPIALVLYAMLEASQLRDQALRSLPKDQWAYVFTHRELEETQCDAQIFDPVVYDLGKTFDYEALYLGATMVASAFGKLQKAVAQIGSFGDFSFSQLTPLGRIIIGGPGENSYNYPDLAFLLDVGGNDTYSGCVGANPSVQVPVSVALDLSGNDLYENPVENLPSQGSGMLGIGMLLDVAGDDYYESQSFSQGSGRFGVGILLDAAGKDEYRSVSFSQGSGAFGIGLQVDLAGDDRYYTYYYAQGYGFSKGLGLLLDRRGNDQYIADDENLIHVGDETPLHNESAAQGYGAGRRADLRDGHDMSGGLGILNDWEGDDTYSCGVFGQGTSYWYGFGLLYDGKGNDSYKGAFFVQGTTAHYSISELLDEGGNDQFLTTMSLGMGYAHDCSVSFFINQGGDDTYSAPGDLLHRNNSVGGALYNGEGFFVDIGGNDTYNVPDEQQSMGVGFNNGSKGYWSTDELTIGMFLDIGGRDRYNSPIGKNNTVWLAPRKGLPKPFPTTKSIGMDVEKGEIVEVK